MSDELEKDKEINQLKEQLEYAQTMINILQRKLSETVSNSIQLETKIHQILKKDSNKEDKSYK